MAAGNFPKPDPADALDADTIVSASEAEAAPEVTESDAVLISINGEPAVSWSSGSLIWLLDADGNLPENVKVVDNE